MTKTITSMLAVAIGLGALTLASDAGAKNVKRWIGKPSFVQVGKAVAVYGWQDKARGLHLRVTAPARNKAYRFRGTVCALDKKGQNTIKSLTPVLLEKNQDSAKVGPHGHCVWFAFKTSGHIDGFDFTTDAKHLLFTIFRDGKKVSPKKIYLGAKGVHPAKNPAVIKR
ncbi:MAG: hypothetical protein DRI90_17085 [Deltaproteobacteria bacterium]|nr:MAG: hypothetical protein DRI90_17085 [Deltaproteobacteria bacterium]